MANFIRRPISFFGKFQTRVTLILIFSMLFVGLLSNFAISQFAITSQFAQFQENLKVIAQITASVIDGSVVAAIPRDRSALGLPEYQSLARKLREVKEKNSSIHFIYILAPTMTDGIWEFVVDPDPLSRQKAGVTSYPGDRYDASRFPEMIKALYGPTADKKIGLDEWGKALSGYAPIITKDGRAVAVLGVDMLAEDIYQAQQTIFWRTFFVLIFGVLLSFLLGMLFSRKITGPIKELAEGMKHISRGDLSYKVKVKSVQEVKELAGSLNKMADDLDELQRKNHNYFYNVIQSLVRIVEAKDSYTKGHSERVAQYAGVIARCMGFPRDTVKFIEETGMLHDVGKLGIQDSILNKKEPLTEDEWEVIRQHPIVGEDILRPVSLSNEILSIVRAHHERYDGNGYPDKLRGNEINIFAQILSVADSYDAMTSTRAYRFPLNKAEAIKELKANRGAQFNPKIVDTFIGALESGMC